jgi:hypothetical protein
MAPLPPDSTPRFKVFYTNSGQQHTMNIRSHDSPSAFGLNVDDFLNALSGLLTATTIDEVQFAATGSNVFNPVTSGIEGNTYGSGAGSTLVRASYVDFIGRSTDGKRVRLAVFGTKDLGTDFRFVAGENADVDAAIVALSAGANHFVTISDANPIWKSYANAGFNAYWQRAERP